MATRDLSQGSRQTRLLSPGIRKTGCARGMLISGWSSRDQARCIRWRASDRSLVSRRETGIHTEEETAAFSTDHRAASLFFWSAE